MQPPSPSGFAPLGDGAATVHLSDHLRKLGTELTLVGVGVSSIVLEPVAALGSACTATAQISARTSAAQWRPLAALVTLRRRAHSSMRRALSACGAAGRRVDRWLAFLDQVAPRRHLDPTV